MIDIYIFFFLFSTAEIFHNTVRKCLTEIGDSDLKIRILKPVVFDSFKLIYSRCNKNLFLGGTAGFHISKNINNFSVLIYFMLISDIPICAEVWPLRDMTSSVCTCLICFEMPDCSLSWVSR